MLTGHSASVRAVAFVPTGRGRRLASGGSDRLVLLWDHDRDGRIRSDEIPANYQLTIGRGPITGVDMSTLRAVAMRTPAGRPAAAGPTSFRKIDRNHVGDISRREFFGPRVAFDRLDADGDNLIDAAEAARGRGEAEQDRSAIAARYGDHVPPASRHLGANRRASPTGRCETQASATPRL